MTDRTGSGWSDARHADYERVLADIADWLVKIGYPADWHCEHYLPPSELRRAIEDACVRKWGDGTRACIDAVRDFAAEEGHWPYRWLDDDEYIVDPLHLASVTGRELHTDGGES